MKWLSRLLAWKREASSASKLSTLIALVADEPTIPHRNAFYQAVAHSKLGVQVLTAPPFLLKAGPHLTTKRESVELVHATLPNGLQLLMAICDVNAQWMADPNQMYLEMDAKVVLRMALENGFDGVMIRNGDERDSWGGIPVSDIQAILAGQYD